jgi:hypothetical protein
MKWVLMSVGHEVFVFIVNDINAKLGVLGTAGRIFFVCCDGVDDLGSTYIAVFVGLKKKGPADQITVVGQGLGVI